MKRAILYFIAISCILIITSCATCFKGGSPWVCSDVKGIITEKDNTDIRENFALAVNKEKIINSIFHDGYSVTGTMEELEYRKSSQLIPLMTETAKNKTQIEKNVRNLYSLILDWDYRNKQGTEPLKQILQPIENIKTIEDLNEYFLNTPYNQQLIFPGSFGITQNFNNSDEYIIAIEGTPLFWYNPADYNKFSIPRLYVQKHSSKLIKAILMKLGYASKQANKTISDCLKFEKIIASSMLSFEESKTADVFDKINNIVSGQELKTLEGKFPLFEVIKRVFSIDDTTQLLLTEPKWLEKLSETYSDDNINLIKSYLIAHTSSQMLTYLDYDCYTKAINFSNKISGIKTKASDEEYAISIVNTALPWSVSKIYVDEYSTEQDKFLITNITNQIISKYHTMIQNTDFFTDETKKRALNKLNSIKKNILYPENWEQYLENVEIKTVAEGESTLSVIYKLNQHKIDEMVKKYNNPVNKDLWSSFPTETNAFYSPQKNSINIMAAFTQGDIYSPNMEYEEVLAKIGFVIGHEITHAFDSTGSQFDENGMLVQWWTDKDKEIFSEKNKKISDFYSSIKPWRFKHLKGQIMTGEACADMGSIHCLLLIAKEYPNFDYDLFFRSYADLWFNQFTWKYAIWRVNDEHPLSYLRINTVLQQFDEFINFYNISPEDKMFLSPQDRVNIW